MNSNNLLTMLAVMTAIAPNGLGSDPFYVSSRKPPKDPTSEESIKKLEAAEAKRKRRAARNKKTHLPGCD